MRVGREGQARRDKARGRQEEPVQSSSGVTHGQHAVRVCVCVHEKPIRSVGCMRVHE